VIHERLFSLLETLAEVDLDWLGLETQQYLMQGYVGLESPDTLTAVRKAISDAVPRDAVNLSFAVDEVEDQPFEKSQQIDLAIAFIVNRLSSLLGMASDSINRLDQLPATESRSAQDRDRRGSLLHVLATPELTYVTSLKELEVAQDFIANLERTLNAWRDSLSDGAP
jgi:hypothetical protein